ncbi:hypothetical protein KVV02_006579 [Mortierella alpina]|uniref:Uncharacterized protein n=1 Tax=Mortierella alpina TaxID=64518 RepID=A0A9P8A4T9_MORAP|nr:hypothetical protein KVV02_006579 [Mortierella alpina]
MTNKLSSDYNETPTEAAEAETLTTSEHNDSRDRSSTAVSTGDWKDILASLNMDSGVLSYMSNCARLPDINYEDFLQHADKTQKEKCSLSRCQSIWHSGVTKLAHSPHPGLQRRARELLRRWSRKEYVQTESIFSLRLERMRGLDEGSLKALAASDIYWNERTCHDYFRPAKELKQQATGEPSGLGRKSGTGDVQQGMQRKRKKQEHLINQATGKDDSSPEQQQEPLSPFTRKRKQSDCITLEPWQTLTKTLYDLINGQAPAFISPPSDMPSIHRFLFNHAQNLLKEVVLSGVMNIMSDRFTSYCESSGNLDIVDSAAMATRIENFDQHECLSILRGYSALLLDEGLEALWFKFCHVISSPPYKTSEPSETDSLLVWTHLFSLITDDIALLSGEKMLEASKTHRREQSREFGDLTEAGRKVDLTLCYDGIELSNIEFKRAGITSKDVTMQCRKNIRLGRCLQEAHRAVGLSSPPIVMVDITGFVGVFYHIVPFEDVWAAGRATANFVHLPTTEGALLDFMSENDTPLAQIFCFFEMLLEKGKKTKRAKERYDLQLAKQEMGQAMGSARPGTPPPKIKALSNSVIFTPSKKRA